MKETLTAKEANRLLRYDPVTGYLYHKITRCSRAKKGERAGTYDKSNGYINIMVNSVLYRAHRVIWLMVHGEWPDKIDHDDQVRSNNKIINLNSVTFEKNNRNKRQHKNNTSGTNGVFFDKKRNVWTAGINVNKKRKYLGSFEYYEDAVNAREEADVRYGYHKNHGVNILQ